MIADAMSAPLVRFEQPIPIERARKPKSIKPSKIQLGGKGGMGASAGSESGTPLLEDILSTIIPPKEIRSHPSDAEPSMVEYVSAQPATRLDVIQLQEVLDNRLVHRQAREFGACHIRSELFAEVFDELIRQITISCPERGLVLLRVRDELRMTLAAHKALYETGYAFGVRKAAIAEHGLPEMRQRIRQLEREKAELEARVQELLLHIDSFEKSTQDDRVVDEKQHSDEVGFFRKTNQQLSTHLKTETEKANSKK